MRKSCKNSTYNNSRTALVDYSKTAHTNKRRCILSKLKLVTTGILFKESKTKMVAKSNSMKDFIAWEGLFQ